MNREQTEKNIEFSFDNIDIDISELEELLKKVTEGLEFNFDIEQRANREKIKAKRKQRKSCRDPQKATRKNKKELL